MVSIRYKFLAIIAATFLVFTLVVLSIWYSILSKEAEHTAVDNMETVIQVSNNVFESQVQDICNVMALTTVHADNYLTTNIINILSNPNLTPAELFSYRKNAGDFLISLCSFKKYINGLMISDFSGNSVTYGITMSFEEIQESPWFQEMHSAENTNRFIEPHYYSKWRNSKNDIVFSITRPVYGFQGNVVGFVMADVKCVLLNDTFDVSAKNNLSLYLMDSKTGRVIFAPEKNTLELSGPEGLEKSVAGKIVGTDGNFFAQANGQDMLFVYHKSQLTDWIILSAVPRAEIVENFNRSGNTVILITAVSIGVMLLLIYLITTLMTRNIVSLTKSVKQVDKDHLQLDLDIRSRDEIGELYQQFVSMITRIEQLIGEVKTTEAAKRKADIFALQSQINPHFLYNTLNTIKFMATLQGADNIRNVSEKLSSLMHITMSSQSFIPLTEEVQYLDDYISIQSYRYVGTFQYEIFLEPGTEQYFVPKLFVQPIVENALKHGLADKGTGGLLTVRIFSEEEKLHIRVEDNGCGMNQQELAELFQKKEGRSGGHIGICNVTERVRQYFGDGYGVEVQSQPNLYTRVELTIPMIEEGGLENYA